MTHAFSPSAWEAEDWDFWVQGQPELNSETETQSQTNKQTPTRRKKNCCWTLSNCSGFFWPAYVLLCISSWILEKKVTHLKWEADKCSNVKWNLGLSGSLLVGQHAFPVRGSVEILQWPVYVAAQAWRRAAPTWLEHMLFRMCQKLLGNCKQHCWELEGALSLIGRMEMPLAHT